MMYHLVDQKYSGFEKLEQQAEVIGKQKQDFAHTLPAELICQIFSSLIFSELSICCLVSRDWCFIANDPFLWYKFHHARAYGKAKWEKHFWNIGDEPPLPSNIHEIMKSPCPIWKEKRVGETHQLILIPSIVCEAFLNHSQLETKEIYKENKCQKISFYEKHDKKNPFIENLSEQSYWVLITKEIVDENNLTFSSKKAFLSNLREERGVEYRFPKPIEAVVWEVIKCLNAKSFWEKLQNLSHDLFCEEKPEDRNTAFILNTEYKLRLGIESVIFHLDKESLYIGQLVAVREFNLISNTTLTL